MSESADESMVVEPASPERVSFWTEDLLAIVIGWTILVVSLACVRFVTPVSESQALDAQALDAATVAAVEPATEAESVLAPWVGKPKRWYSNPMDAFRKEGKSDDSQPVFAPELSRLSGVVGAALIIGGLFTLTLMLTGGRGHEFLIGFPAVFLLGLLAYVMAGQAVVSAYNLEYALWALLVGLVISNTVGVPQWIRGAARTEFYIKTGLVLLGSEILMSRLLALGLPGVFVAWVVTPIVLITTFWFGQKVLKIKSPTLNMVISADMSVCGVSAAIASAAACRAKKEELSLAIGMSLSFTVIMMVVMPMVIRFTGMDEVLGGAWMGGTIDSTGAVAAAGEFLGDRALEVAATIKMIQNILIGVVAFGIAVFWTTYMDRDPAAKTSVGWSEIWLRFPKFILGFIAASVAFSLIAGLLSDGALWTSASIGVTKGLRGWLFCLAFVSIGLETNYAAIKDNLSGGKPLLLYVCGQSLNLVLTLAMAYLMFKVVFAESGM
ncbi:putative membrane protein YadS [Rhodopirellula rubra]|uniref:Putative membrane protein YadS n=1 Tax=Aporhodopirellula rubra TaxID=980271 RepID=A0A7W5DW78_9BACT|nr:putative sulfate exporter family transporter [Aporhodopirellula rubra]MBB3205638.1 putative membrane protein YadS [Aporhodopirellula rubra]